MAPPNVYFVYKLPDALTTLQFDRTYGRYVFVCCLPRKYFVRCIVYGVSAVSYYTFGAGTRDYTTCERCVIRKTKPEVWPSSRLTSHGLAGRRGRWPLRHF